MKNKILELLKKQNDFISGEEIGKICDISRGGVWKNISKLRELGYNITSVTNKGYFLNDCEDILNDYELETSILTKVMGKKFLYLNEIDSTNEEAKRQAQNGAKEGFLVVSENQTKGKGRLGNKWNNSDKNCLSFSLVLKPSLPPDYVTSLTLIVGLSVCEALREIGAEAFLKWPNDIIVNKKKMVGILTEMSCEIEQVNYIVAGIGINVNTEMFDEAIAQKATSLFIEMGKKFKRIDVLNKTLVIFEKNYYKFISNGFSGFITKYERLCLNIGKEVRAFLKGDEISGTAVGISQKGELIIRNDDSDNISIVSGEVSVRTRDGKYV